MTISIEQITNIIPHPNADKLNLLCLGGYQFISNKEMNYQLGDLVLTIPEEHDVSAYLSILQEPFKLKDDGIIRRMQLRGSISQGIIVSADLLAEMGFNINELPVGTDLCETLNIPEYIRPIPPDLLDKVEHYKHPLAKYFDCVYPAVGNLSIGDNIVITEKLHGTQVNYIIQDGQIITSSKGLFKSKMVFKSDVNNEYTLGATELGLLNKFNPVDYVQVVGELIPYFKGFNYGLNTRKVYIFVVYINGQPLTYTEIKTLFPNNVVPLVYEGPLLETHYDYKLSKGPKLSLLDGKTLCEGYCISNGDKVVKIKNPKFLDKNAEEA
jgi:RNA ligase (TIGR02306 family)